jgi:hypothetical protein
MMGLMAALFLFVFNDIGTGEKEKDEDKRNCIPIAMKAIERILLILLIILLSCIIIYG